MATWVTAIDDEDSSVMHVKREYETLTLCGALGMLETGLPVTCQACLDALRLEDSG
jgi:hypothetical protein